MRRRAFVASAGAALALPFAARAQQTRTPTIGFLSSGSFGLSQDRVLAFRQGLKEGGYIEGRNVAIEFRWAEDRYDQSPAMAADLVRRDVNVIAAVGNSSPALAVRAATTTVPAVFSLGANPIRIGLVASLNRPGGNLTGVVLLSGDLGPKRLELLRDAVPTANVIGLLINPASTVAEGEAQFMLTAARSLGREIQLLSASTEREVETALTTLMQTRARALVFGTDAFSPLEVLSSQR